MALAFLLFGTAQVEAAPVEVFRGTLGKADVVMELGQPQADGMRQGRYFYRRYGVDIPLQGRLEALAEAQLLTSELMEQSGKDAPLFADVQKRSVIWHVQQQGDALLGEWVDGIGGKKLPIALRRIAQYDPERIAPKGVEAVTKAIVQGAGSGVSSGVAITLQSAPYDYWRVAQPVIPLERGKEVVLAPDLAWQPVRDVRTRMWYPRLTRHPDARILAQTNFLLEQRHWGMSLDALGCKGSLYLDLGPAAGSLGDFDKEDIKVSYLSRSLMSVVESGSTYCGGAHPNNHYDPFVLDLLNGGYMDFTRLLKGAKYGEYGLELGSPLMAKIRKAAAEQEADEGESGCAEYLPEFMALMFDRPGKLSFVISGIGHARGVCLGSGVSLSFKALKPLLKPGARAYLQP